MTTESAAMTHDIFPKMTQEKWIELVELLMAFIVFLDDDAGAFAALGICLFDIINQALPMDPRKFLIDLDQFLLHQEAEGDDDGPVEN